MTDSLKITSDGSLILKEPVTLPEILDVLIVGGGPGGTAAAFHAKEIGLSILVIDFDDIMKRIRDYPKDKLILPDFGGGDKMKFPAAGDKVNALHFGPIDKDDIYLKWKEYYHQFSIPAMTGVELTGLNKREDSIWEIKSWNYNINADQIFLAKHVILSIGTGVPRRFDIPGNTDGIAYRLNEAEAYVGSPTCVIGGGTSAAEAVISISHAKKKANDNCEVCWSYRGTTLPRVSKALAEAYFDAHMNNGNIRYYPNSDAAAVVTAEDRMEYLSIRVDRKSIEGKPNETAHIEFPKECCIACIGQDIPEGLLSSIGISIRTGGPKNKKRMLVNKQLQTELQNVYMVGDILSQAYFETDDFNADPNTYTEIKHRGNIKSAMRDGVYVSKVIEQRLAGKPDTEISLDDAENVEAAKPMAPEGMVTVAIETEGPPAASVEKERQTEAGHAWLIRILPGNVEENEYALNENGVTTIGRADCDINFPDDTILSEKHASITHSASGYLLRDDGSANGLFLKAEEGKPMELTNGDLIKTGRQFLMLDSSGPSPLIIHYDHTGAEQNRYPITEKTIVLGRDAPDVTLDAKDMTLSRRHLTLSIKEGKVILKDLISVNGTYLRIQDSINIDHGTFFRAGQQLFCLTLRQDAVLTTGHIVLTPPSIKIETVPPVPETPVEKPQPVPREGGGTEPAVTFKNNGKRFIVNPGQTICEVAEANGLDITAECHAGICGSDPIKIISGHENLSPIGDDETEAIEDICDLDPKECRLACMVKVNGPVEIEILKQ